MYWDQRADEINEQALLASLRHFDLSSGRGRPPCGARIWH